MLKGPHFSSLSMAAACRKHWLRERDQKDKLPYVIVLLHAVSLARSLPPQREGRSQLLLMCSISASSAFGAWAAGAATMCFASERYSQLRLVGCRAMQGGITPAKFGPNTLGRIPRPELSTVFRRFGAKRFY